MNKAMDYEQLTREEIVILTLERMREAKITQITQTDISIEALKIAKAREGNSSKLRTNLAVNIGNLGGEYIALEDDLKLLEKKLREAKKGLKNTIKGKEVKNEK